MCSLCCCTNVLLSLKTRFEVSKQVCLQIHLSAFYRFESTLASPRGASLFLPLAPASIMRFPSSFTTPFDASEEEVYPQGQEGRARFPWEPTGRTYPLLWNSTAFSCESQTCAYKSCGQEHLCCLGWYKFSFLLRPSTRIFKRLLYVLTESYLFWTWKVSSPDLNYLYQSKA